jgi:hypothetical protein
MTAQEVRRSIIVYIICSVLGYIYLDMMGQVHLQGKGIRTDDLLSIIEHRGQCPTIPDILCYPTVKLICQTECPRETNVATGHLRCQELTFTSQCYAISCRSNRLDLWVPIGSCFSKEQLDSLSFDLKGFRDSFDLVSFYLLLAIATVFPPVIIYGCQKCRSTNV